MGHRHLPLDLIVEDAKTGAQSRYVNIGDWTSYYSWAVLDNGVLELKK